MKKIRLIISLLCTIYLSIPVLAAEAAPVAAAESSSPQIQDCPSANQEIRNYCSQNETLVQAQAAMDQAGTVGRTGVGATAQSGQTYARQSQSAIAEAQQQCSEAARQCDQVCSQAQQEANAQTPPNTAEYNQATQVRNFCRQEKQTMETKASAMQANLAEILQAIAAIMQALGLGQGSDGAITAAEDPEEEDKCKGEYADLLIECQGQSDPSGTRASLSGVGSLNGRTTGGLGNLFDGGQTGEPGGEDKGQGGDGGSGSPFGAAGVAGGSGLGGTSAGAAAGAGGKEGFDTDINKGYMGTGGFGDGGGGGGGGGASGGGSRYGAIGGMDGAAGVNKADRKSVV